MILRSDLDPLPLAKQAELTRAVKILMETFEASLQGKTAPHRRTGAILKVILFGSFARGDWVEDRKSGYLSDFDILVVVNHEKLTDAHDHWDAADDRLRRAYAISKTIRRPVNFIVHSLADVNEQLRRGRPFFLDIVRDGVALYEAPGHPFVDPAPLSPEAARQEAQGYFDTWFPMAIGFMAASEFHLKRSEPKLAAFNLHQAVERLYHCTLLVLTLYSPRAHKIDVLRDLAEEAAPRLIEAWPRDTRFARRAFDRIRRAYVEARYSPHYKITPDEMAWCVECIGRLQAIVKAVCDEKLVIDGPIDR